MGEERDTRTMPYVLCAVTGAGVMFNLILLVWHCIKFKAHKASVYVKIALAFLHLWYMAVGVAVSLLILYKDLHHDWLCRMGGFLVLFTTQESLWTLAITCGTVMLWKYMQSLPRSQRIFTHHQKWKKPMFLLSLVLKCVLLALISLLPLIKLSFFDSETDFYFVCTPLRLPGEQGWPYSTSIIALDWIAVIIASVCITLSMIITRRTSRTLDMTSANSTLSSTRTAMERETRQYTLRQHVVLPFSVVAWLLILIITSVGYFSRGAAISAYHIQWMLGFLISTTIVLHPTLTLVTIMISHTHWIIPKAASCAKCAYCGHKSPSRHSSTAHRPDNLTSSCPKTLVSLAKMPSTHLQHDQNVLHFLVQWRDHGHNLMAGIMKVYAPSYMHKWRREVNVLSKMATKPHPNVAHYHWQNPHNNFTAAICTFTRQIVSPESSLTCRAHYPHGSLHQFLKSKGQRLTEVTLHKVTRDIAAGLDHLHQLHLVHNALSTHCVYLSSVPQPGGVRAVIGDFENSYEVSIDPFTLSNGITQKDCIQGSKHKHPIWSISSELEKDNSKFAPDIRTFGQIVLEMLVSLKRASSEEVSWNRRSRSLSDLLPVEQTSGEVTDCDFGAHIHRSCKDCKCPSKVKDIRACADKPDSDMKLFSNFMDILNDHQKDRSKGDQSPVSLSSSWKVSAFSSQQQPAFSPTFSTHHHSQSLPDDLKVHKASPTESIQLRALPPVPKPQSANSSHNSSKDSSQSTCTDSDSNAKSLIQRRKKAHLSHMNRTLRQMERNELSDEELDVQIPIYNDDFSHAAYSKPSNVYVDVKDCQTENTTGKKGEGNPKDLRLKLKRPSCIPCDGVQSGSSSDNSPATPCTEDIYNTSLGSLVSFETIYEDEESGAGQKKADSGTGMPITRIAHQRRFQRVHRKKSEEARATHKRMSTSSLDGSVVSGDSGFGSTNHCDLLSTCSEVSQLFKSGTRDTVYAENVSASDSDSYSLVHHYLAGRNGRHTDSGIESNAESAEDSSSRNSKVVSSPEDGSSPSTHLPDLRLMKQPCKNTHAHPASHPHPCMHPSSPGQCEDHENFDKDCQFCNSPNRHIHIQDSIHPAIRHQYSYKTSQQQPLPKLGVSAVHTARRMSAKSSTCSSVTSGSTETLDSIFTNSDRKLAIGDISELSNKTERMRQRPVSDMVTSFKSSPAPDLASPTPSEPCRAQSCLSQSSFSSSIADLINDSDLIIRDIMNKENQYFAKNQRRSSQGSRRPGHVTRSSARSNHQGSAEDQPTKKVIQDLRETGNLGFIAQQMMPLLNDCCLDDCPPSTEEILKRLERVLPTMAV